MNYNIHDHFLCNLTTTTVLAIRTPHIPFSSPQEKHIITYIHSNKLYFLWQYIKIICILTTSTIVETSNKGNINVDTIKSATLWGEGGIPFRGSKCIGIKGRMFWNLKPCPLWKVLLAKEIPPNLRISAMNYRTGVRLAT